MDCLLVCNSNLTNFPSTAGKMVCRGIWEYWIVLIPREDVPYAVVTTAINVSTDESWAPGFPGDRTANDTLCSSFLFFSVNSENTGLTIQPTNTANCTLPSASAILAWSFNVTCFSTSP